MWLVRLWIRVARPIARGRKRFSVGPSSTVIAWMRISSPIRSWLFSALATADSSSFCQSSATPRGVCARIARASSTDLPRIWSPTSRALRADVRTYWPGADDRALAGLRSRFGGLGSSAGSASAFLRVASARLLSAPRPRPRLFGRRAPRRPRRPALRHGGLDLGGLLGSLVLGVGASSARPRLADLPGAGVAAEGAGRRELAELVADHRLARRRRARACGRRGRRSCARPSPGRSSSVRDQVLTICLLPASFIASMRPIRRSSTNGPFLVERPIGYLPFFLPRRRPRTM